MAEYIERDAAVNGLAKIINESDMPEDWNKGMSAAMLALFRIPSADVRPVVFCRDCTFFKPQQKSARWSNATPRCSRSATIKMPPDGFCSFGVKREES